MKQCPNCGNSCNDFDAACSYCGFQFDSAGNSNNCSSSSNNNYSADNNSTNNNNSANDSNNYSVNSDNYSVNNDNYSSPYYQNAAPFQPKTNSYAIASLVLGIVSIPLMCCCVGVITAILAVIFGFLARNKIAASNGYETGNGMALAGIIMGFAVIGISLILMIVSLASGSSVNFWEQFNKSFQDEFKKQLEQQGQVQ